MAKAVKNEEITAIIDEATGEVRIMVVSDRPGHSDALLPFEVELMAGGGTVHKHVHDHSHGKVHTHDGGKPHSH